MPKKIVSMSFFLIFVFLAGCTSTSIKNVTIEEQVVYIKLLTKHAVYLSKDKLKKDDVESVINVINDVVLPYMRTNDVNMAWFQDVINKNIPEKYKIISGDVMSILSMYLVVKSPVSMLSEDNKKRLIAFFEGMYEGSVLVLEAK